MLPKKILIANVPADGHFNPLTSIAVHLKNLGHDVRWYTQDFYKSKIEKLGIKHYPFVNQPQVNQENFKQYFQERDQMKSQIAKLNFDLEHFFIKRTPEAISDLTEIRREFPFDLLIADILFLALPMAKAKFNIPVVAAGIIPVNESSVDLPPAGLGLIPGDGIFSGIKNFAVKFLTNKLIFGRQEKLYRSILKEYNVNAPAGNLFDIVYRTVDMVWQSGAPGFEYHRSDWNPAIRFVGPMLPFRSGNRLPYILKMQKKYEKIVLVTQGTAEGDINKIIVPTLEAYKDTDTLVIATTGFNGTEELRKRYPQSNFIIEDFIPFSDVMPVCDVYITNGGYGGVLLGIQNKLPMVVAGVHEGKNEICARVGYFNLGINLKTEKPIPSQIKDAVEKIVTDKKYKQQVITLAAAFRTYDTNKIVEELLTELFPATQSIVRTLERAGKKDIA